MCFIEQKVLFQHVCLSTCRWLLASSSSRSSEQKIHASFQHRCQHWFLKWQKQPCLLGLLRSFWLETWLRHQMNLGDLLQASQMQMLWTSSSSAAQSWGEHCQWQRDLCWILSWVQSKLHICVVLNPNGLAPHPLFLCCAWAMCMQPDSWSFQHDKRLQDFLAQLSVLTDKSLLELLLVPREKQQFDEDKTHCFLSRWSTLCENNDKVDWSATHFVSLLMSQQAMSAAVVHEPTRSQCDPPWI